MAGSAEVQVNDMPPHFSSSVSRGDAGLTAFTMRPPVAGTLGLAVAPSGGVRRLPVVAVVLVALAWSPSPRAQTADQIRDAATEAIRRLDLQTELPKDPTPEEPPFRLHVPEPFLWIALIGGAAALLYHLRDVIPLWRFPRDDQWEGGPGDAAGGTPQAAAAVMGAADELARQGRFVEAMHVLLLQALAELRRRLDEPFADSLTSREILRRVALSDRGRNSLRDLVARVEWTYFGAYPAAQADYAACRDSYDELTQALRRDGRA